MRRTLGLVAPLCAVAGLVMSAGPGEAGWRRGHRSAPCPPVVYYGPSCPPAYYGAPGPPIMYAPQGPPTAFPSPAAGTAATRVRSAKTGRVYAVSDTGEAQPEEKDVRPLPPPTGKTGIDPSNSFRGKARRAAKLSISAAPLEEFTSVSELLTGPARLRPDDEMKMLMIPEGEDSNRVAAEQRNLRVRAFLFAFKKEADNDYHVIIGDPPGTPGARYFNVEVSGLPTDDDNPTPEARDKLTATRTTFKTFFGLGNAGPNSYFRVDPPVEVTVTGSAFWDTEHAPPNTVGPTAFKPRSAWEIHPITSIVLEP